jgi:uncharacterized FlgJ-related protein
MYHFYTSKSYTNPFTREKLTIEDIEEYNKLTHIKNRITSFIEELEQYKNS